jgi:hypothetical protein
MHYHPTFFHTHHYAQYAQYRHAGQHKIYANVIVLNSSAKMPTIPRKYLDIKLCLHQHAACADIYCPQAKQDAEKTT